MKPIAMILIKIDRRISCSCRLVLMLRWVSMVCPNWQCGTTDR